MIGKIIQGVDTKATKKVRCLMKVDNQVWAGSADNRIYIYDYTNRSFIKVINLQSLRCRP